MTTFLSVESLVASVAILVGGGFLVGLALDASKRKGEARSLLGIIGVIAVLAPLVAGQAPLMTFAGHIIFTIFFFLLSLTIWASNRDRLFIGSVLGFLATVALSRCGG